MIEYFSRLAGIKLQAVPFRGGNQALTELLGERLDFLIDPPIALIGQIKSGALHPIAVTGGARFAALPDVGTIAEAGFPGFSITSWMAWSARRNCRSRSRRGSTPRSTRWSPNRR